MRILIAALCLILIAPFAARVEDAPPADPLKGKPIAHWIERLGSDIFTEREEATQALSDAGEPAVPALKKALESADNEVRLRAQLALVSLATLSIEGQFVRISSESFGSNGRPTFQSNEAGESTLAIGKGRVVFTQEYGKGVEQIYSFPELTSLNFRKKCTIDLNWESIDVRIGYNPDSDDAKLECVSTPQGLRVTLSAKDTAGTSFKMIYAPRTEIERERAASPGSGIGNPIKER